MSNTSIKRKLKCDRANNMRATNIGIRSPKEFTPAPYASSVTYDGRNLFGNSEDRPHSFWKAERFRQYHQEAKKTGYRVGPGSYNIDTLAMGRVNALNTLKYKPLHSKGNRNSSYYMVGQTLVSGDQKDLSATDYAPGQLPRKNLPVRRNSVGDTSVRIYSSQNKTRKTIRFRTKPKISLNNSIN